MVNSPAVAAAAAAAAPRDGFAEALPKDRENIQRRVTRFEGIKQASEFFGRRPRRFCLRPADWPLEPGAKRVHLVRHGQGHHNVWRASETAAGRTPSAKRGNMDEVPAELHDPHLTERGRSEAAVAKLAVGACKPQLLVTSPLRRTVETMQIVFQDAVAAGVTALAHELCREQFQGLDPSIYDSRKARGQLAREFPRVDFSRYVLPEDTAARHLSNVAVAGDDPIWWHCGSTFGACEGGSHEAAMVENAWGFLSWLMARPEQEIAVVTHQLFLLALYHGALEPESGASFPFPQAFHTAELRSVVIVEREPPAAVGGQLVAWAPALLGAGLGHTDLEVERDESALERKLAAQRRSRSRSPRRVVA